MKFFLVFLSFIYSLNSFAQQYDNNWLVGAGFFGTKSAKITFNTPILIDSLMRPMSIDKTSLSVSDSLGNLIFYSNGIQINDTQHQLMQNGDSLNPSDIANNNVNFGYTIPEAIISIPHPSQTNKYYIFHLSMTYATALAGLSEKLYYTLVDMNANGGLGRVELKNQVLLENDSLAGGQLEVVRHGNGRDWWLIQPMSGSNGYHIFLITDNSVIYHHKQYLGTNKIIGTEGAGQATFSHDGNKYFRYDYRNDLDLYDFDRCSGYLSNYLHISIIDSIDNFTSSGASSGVAISSNDRYLYVSSWIYMYQFDLLASNIAASKDTVAIHDNFTPTFIPTLFGFIQTGPDGKIYGHAYSTRYLHVIDNPNLNGTACNVRQHDIDIFFPNGQFLPNFPHYRTPALAGSACDTLTNIVDIQNDQINDVSLYPNPNNGVVTIESEFIMQNIVIYDALGKEVISELNIGKYTRLLDTKILENGAYIASIKLANGRILNKKMIVQRE